MKKLLLSLILVLSLGLVACGGKDDSKSNEASPTASESGTTSNEGQEASNSGNATTTPEAGKNQVDSDKTATDSIETKNSDDIYNIGGILFEIPETFKKKAVFVGAKNVYESTKNQCVLSMVYMPYQLGVEYGPELVDVYMNGIYPVTTDSVEEMMSSEMDRPTSLSVTSFREKKDELTEETSVAGFKTYKTTVEGTIYGDCYREAPVKDLAEVVKTTYLIINDVDQTFISVDFVCKKGKAETVSKQAEEMLAAAVKTDRTDNLSGKYSDSHIEIGGFAYEVPKVYGTLGYYDYYYDSEGYFYQYYDIPKSEDENPTWWTNFNAYRQVMTKAEFEEEADLYMDDIITGLGEMFSENQTLERKAMEIGGMQAVYYHSQGSYEGTPMECKMVLVNNTQDRFLIMNYGIYEQGDEEKANAFEELLGSMTLIKK